MNEEHNSQALLTRTYALLHFVHDSLLHSIQFFPCNIPHMVFPITFSAPAPPPPTVLSLEISFLVTKGARAENITAMMMRVTATSIKEKAFFIIRIP